MRKLGESTAKRIELDLTHQFTFGMSAASYTNMDGETVSTTSADGQNIFDSDHTITGGSSTYSNLITTAFSRAGLEEAENKFNTFVDNNGNIVLVEPDTIITGRNVTIQNAVKEFLKSTLIPLARKAVQALEKGYIFGIAPEGTRNITGRLKRAHPGAVMLALHSGAPMLPVAHWGGENLIRNLKRLKRTDFHIRVGEPFCLRLEGVRVTKEIRQQIVDEMMYRLAELLPPEYRGEYQKVTEIEYFYTEPCKIRSTDLA